MARKINSSRFRNRRFVEHGITDHIYQMSDELLMGGRMTGEIADCITDTVRTDSSDELPSVGLKNTKIMFSCHFVCILISIFVLLWERAARRQPEEQFKSGKGGKRKTERKMPRPKGARIRIRPIDSGILGGITQTANHSIQLSQKPQHRSKVTRKIRIRPIDSAIHGAIIQSVNHSIQLSRKPIIPGEGSLTTVMGTRKTRRTVVMM